MGFRLLSAFIVEWYDERPAHSLENFSGRAQNHSVWAVFTGTLRAVSAESGVANEVADRQREPPYFNRTSTQDITG